MDANYWAIWTSNAYPDGYTNIVDEQGVTFQRFADPAADAQPRYSAGLTFRMTDMRKITAGGVLSGDFAVTMSYTNLNHFVSASYDGGIMSVNRMKLQLFWGDGGAPERVHEVGAFSYSIRYYGYGQRTVFQGSTFDSQGPWQGGEFLERNPEGAATLKIARTNGVLSFYVNGQQFGVGEGPDMFTTNDIWGVNLMLGQEWESGHLGVTFQSCSISGPSVKDFAPLSPPLLKLVSADGGNFCFGWDAALGQAYQVQTATNLNAVSWDNLGSSFVATTSPVAVTNAIGHDPARFYRVQAIGN